MLAARDRRMSAVSVDEGGVGARGCNAWEDVLAVEMGAPVRELAVVGGDQESRLVNLALVDSDAPEGKEINVGVDVALVKILFSLVLADVLLLSCPPDDDQRKGGEGVRCKNRIAKEGSGEEARECLEVDKAAAIDGGSWEGREVVNRGAAHDVFDGGDDCLDRAESSVVVHDDEDGGRANPDESAHFVGGAEKGAAKVVGVVEDRDLLFVIGREEKTVGLVEPRHFYVEACLKIHHAGETSNVSIAGLVHPGDQVKKGFPGGMEGHGVAFFISTKATADGLGFDDKGCGGNDKSILSKRIQTIP